MRLLEYLHECSDVRYEQILSPNELCFHFSDHWRKSMNPKEIFGREVLMFRVSTGKGVYLFK